MFRTLGLRHLCVINSHNQILGIVTRADLVSAHFLSDMSYDLDSRHRRETAKGGSAVSSSKAQKYNGVRVTSGGRGSSVSDLLDDSCM